jgi:hypothetical protein
MTNGLLFDLAGLLTAYRNVPEFQQRTIEISKVLVAFLDEKQLFADPDLGRKFDASRDVKIWSDDLTERGKAICIGKGNALSRWLASMSHVERKITTKILDKEYSRLTQQTH